jgi:hypothetical protein
MWLRNLNDTLSLMFFGCSSRNQEVWVVRFGLVDSLALVPFNLYISFHLVYLVFYSWINPQTFGTRLKWGWLNKTPIFDHFPVDSTLHLHTLYCKRFVRLRVLIKTHITFCSTPSDLHQLEVQWWIFSFILQTSCLEDVNLRITSSGFRKSSECRFFSLWFPASWARSWSSINLAFYMDFYPLLDFSGSAGFGTWRISVPLFWATCRLFSILLLFWILESFCLWILLLCLPLYFWDIEGE